jgi:heme-degrading monooxygenase HmoA
MIANTPPAPYYAVIFTSIRSEIDNNYGDMAQRMVELGSQMKGFLGIESARNDIGITVSYWETLEDISNWKQNSEHQIAQQTGRKEWYKAYKTRICKVERDYDFGL